MLAFNKEVISERSDEQLRLLQEEVIRKIKEIENAKEFPTKVSKLCDYCEYKTICPAFKHKLEVEAKREASNLKEDEGVSLVNKLSEIKERISSLEEERQKIEKEIMEFAKNKNVNVVFGDKIQANIRSFLKIEIPEEKKEELIRILKRKGLYEKYSMLSYYKLNSDLINEKILEDDIKKIIKIVKDYRLTLTKRKDIEL